MSLEGSLGEHRQFLNRYYGVSRWFYDLTRKYYLFGRDQALELLLGEPWQNLVEVGPGTGRNLRAIKAARPTATLGGLEASDEMLEHARLRCPWASFTHGYAENADLTLPLGTKPDRILFSYCLSMTLDPAAALEKAKQALAPGGQILIVDFSDFATAPRPLARGLTSWLQTFHVKPFSTELLLQHNAELTFGPLRYYVIARIRQSEPQT